MIIMGRMKRLYLLYAARGAVFFLILLLNPNSSLASLEISADQLLQGSEARLRINDEISFSVDGKNYTLTLDSFDTITAEILLSENNDADEALFMEEDDIINISVGDASRLEISFIEAGAIELNLKLKLIYSASSKRPNTMANVNISRPLTGNASIGDSAEVRRKIIPEEPLYLLIWILAVILLALGLITWKYI